MDNKRPAEASHEDGPSKRVKIEKVAREAYNKIMKEMEELAEINRAKAIGEKIRIRNANSAERIRLIDEFHNLIGNQEKYVKYILEHNMGKVLRFMYKHGSDELRREISLEIIPSAVRLLKNRDGRAVVKCMLKYCSNNIRKRCIEVFDGHAVELASNLVSAPVFDHAYRHYATPDDHVYWLQEFFGSECLLTEDHKHLRDVIASMPIWAVNDKAEVLRATKANLQKVLHRDLLDSALVQTAIAQFLSVCAVDDRQEMISELAPYLAVLSRSKDGAMAARICFWQGDETDRRIAMRALKPHTFHMCRHEHAHTTIICVLDSADNEVVLNQTIIKEILLGADDLVQDYWGRRVLAWIVSPGDAGRFCESFIAELERGRSASCKKPAHLRRHQIVEHCVTPLLNKIAASPRIWFMDARTLHIAARIVSLAAFIMNIAERHL